jgi:hypothetical protein
VFFIFIPSLPSSDRSAILSRQASRQAPVNSSVIPLDVELACCVRALYAHFSRVASVRSTRRNMRLLEYHSTGTLSFTQDYIGDDEIPPYAILSHTWQHGQEVTYNGFNEVSGKSKAGWDKIRFCAQQAKRDNLHHIWVDTCCINKAEHVELQDAINSMFRWYQNANQCYVYLWDVSTGNEFRESNWEPAFRESKWFTRGWVIEPRYGGVRCLSK